MKTVRKENKGIFGDLLCCGKAPTHPKSSLQIIPNSDIYDLSNNFIIYALKMYSFIPQINLLALICFDNAIKKYLSISAMLTLYLLIIRIFWLPWPAVPRGKPDLKFCFLHLFCNNHTSIKFLEKVLSRWCVETSCEKTKRFTSFLGEETYSLFIQLIP